MVSAKEITQFCQLNYGVTFPMFAKTSVVGANANPLFHEPAARTGKPPRWNFQWYPVSTTTPLAGSRPLLEEARKLEWWSVMQGGNAI